MSSGLATERPANGAARREATRLSDVHLQEEKSLVAALMVNPASAALVEHMVSGDYFRDADLGHVFDFLVSLHRDGVAFDDPTVLIAELRDAGLLEAVGGKGGIGVLIQETPNAAHVVYHAQQIASKHQLRIWGRIGRELTQRSLRPDADPAAIAQWWSEQQEGLAPVQSDELAYEILTAAELAEGDYKVSYLVEGVVSEGQPLMLSGPQKTLKTSLAIDLQISLATGDPFLGHFAVNGIRRTLLMSGESGLSTIQETAKRICRAKGRDLRDVANVMFSREIPLLYSDIHLKALERLIDHDGVQCLIIDPAYLCIDGTEAGNLFAIGKQLRPVSEICQDRGVTLILLHHTRKNAENTRTGEPLELSDIAWSGFAEFARQWLLVGRRKRYVEGSGRHELWLTYGGSAGHSGLVGVDIEEFADGEHAGRTWDLSVLNPAEARQEARQSDADAREAEREAKKQATVEKNAEKVRAAFRGNGSKGLTKSNIRDRAGLSGGSAGEAIGYLLRIGELEECEVATRTGSYEGFRCVPKS